MAGSFGGKIRLLHKDQVWCQNLVACSLIGIGIYIQIQFNTYLDFFSKDGIGPGFALTVISFIMFIVSIFGCYGALKENYCCIMMFAVLLSVTFIIPVATGAVHYRHSEAALSKFSYVLNGAMSNYGSKDNDGVTLAWDKLQQTLECCGATTYEEWYSKPRTPLVPTSCCIDPKSTQCEHRRQTPIDNNFYTTGCVTALRNWVKEEAALVLGVCIGIGVIQIVGIILACCLGKAIRKQYKVL